MFFVKFGFFYTISIKHAHIYIHVYIYTPCKMLPPFFFFLSFLRDDRNGFICPTPTSTEFRGTEEIHARWSAMAARFRLVYLMWYINVTNLCGLDGTGRKIENHPHPHFLLCTKKKYVHCAPAKISEWLSVKYCRIIDRFAKCLTDLHQP